MGNEVNTAALAKRPSASMTLGDKGFNFDFQSALDFARELIDAGMAPKGVSKPGAIVGLIQAGRELGLPPMMALANLTFTNGRIGIMGDAAMALIRSGGHLEPGTDFEVSYSGAEKTAEWTCTVTAQRKGQAERFSYSFALRDAINAKLARIWTDGTVQSATRDGYGTDGPWAKYTARMLKYRALGFLCKDHFSDVLLGCVVEEELRDYPSVPTPRGETPTGPDPLLISTRCDGNHAEPMCGDTECWLTPITAEIEDDPSPQQEEPPARNSSATFEERATAFIQRMKEKKTRKGLDSAWKMGAGLLDELAANGMGRLLDRVQGVYDERARELPADNASVTDQP